MSRCGRGDFLLTYQDLLAVGEDEKARMDFIWRSINEHEGSKAYQVAVDAELYFKGENPTINRYEKIIYDMQGRAHKDMYTANHKIASSFFGFDVRQEVSYLLGNGVTFQDDATKDRLGKKFDLEMVRAGKYALVAGVAFGFWNLDHLEVFKLREFVPLYDEENGALMAGIRFWQVEKDKPLRATLYEVDGYTDYIRRKGEDMTVLKEKRPYVLRLRTSQADGTEIYDGQNYPSFPIVPLKNGEDALSELTGKRNTVDALDLCTSNMVNNVDEGNLIYWVLTNCGGMDDLDDAKFLDKVRTSHIAHAGSDGDEGATAEPRTIEAPFQGTEATIDMLKRKLYEDFQAFDSSAVSAGNQTATAIAASYTPLDLKVDDFEASVTEFILCILELAGIDDEPSYTRNRIINKSEEIQTLLMGAEYYDDEYITKKLLTINGDADQYDELMKRKQAEEAERVEEEPEEGFQPQEGMEVTENEGQRME
nr:MAG TPA: PORTAL PROTEIN [Caudoviricetes sp.]